MCGIVGAIAERGVTGIPAGQRKLYVFADESIQYNSGKSCELINLPNCPDILEPFVFTIPLQLLSYHVAIIKGTDIDHPRNFLNL